MKSCVKVTLAFIALVAFICLLIILSYLRTNQDTYKPNPLRPEDFPEILIAPEQAYETDYSSPSNSRRVPCTYELSFEVKDPYPGESTRNFIEKHLMSQGWYRLDYSLLNPDWPPIRQVWVLDTLRRPNTDIHRWQEEWMSTQGDHIMVILEYAVPQESNEDLDSLTAYLILLGKDSWIKPYVSKFKKLHPNEFESKTPRGPQ